MESLENEPILRAVRDHLAEHLDFDETVYTVTLDPKTYTPGQIIIEPITPPDPESLTWMGGYDRADTTIQVTIIAPNYAEARILGDRVRTALCGKNRRQYIHPLTIPDRVVESVKSNLDGHADTDGRTSQWAERYTIAVQ